MNDYLIEERIRKFLDKTEGLEHTVKRSGTTSSVYVKMKYRHLFRTIRISDHKPKKHIRNISVHKHTKWEKIERQLNKEIEAMKTKYIYYLIANNKCVGINEKEEKHYG